ncbi:hypothetical protein EBR78_01345 [bacterium]|nr:hypothetical protein [bacterium]
MNNWWKLTFLVLVLAVPGVSEEIHAQRPLPKNIKRILEARDIPPFVRECFPRAIEKLKAKAEAKNALLKKESIQIEEIDDRWYNPSKYVWFSAKIETPDGVEKITVLVQKPLGGACR